ncbi:MAG: XRE family transcriptional regulator [Ottowia sp.]|nr:XRE family transcriptional regulator [Ottowia sp.]
MKTRTIDGIKIEEGSGNVYADLGVPDAEEMLAKCRLCMKIEEIIKARGWTQQQAAAVLGVPQPKLSKMLRGQFRGISQARLIECLTRLGRNVHIVVDPDDEERADRVGRLDVVFA